MHGNVGLVSVGQFEGRVLDFGDLAFRQQAQSVDKSQICHKQHHNECRKARTVPVRAEAARIDERNL